MGITKINTDPTRRDLNLFGFIWLGFMTFFGAVACFHYEAPRTSVVLWLLAIVVPVIGWIFPRFMRAVFVGMSYAAWPIGFV
ncbi:MAG: hypothetical protein GY906_32330, partial [bacterium]|nr:hypothetical protein [bacterium]